MVSSASLLSSKLVASKDLGWRPFVSFTWRLSLAIAFTFLDQSENLCRQSNNGFVSFTWMSWTWTFFGPGSLLETYPTLTLPLGNSFCHRNPGPVKQLEDVSSSAVTPLEAWSAGFSSEATYFHCVDSVLCLMRSTRFATNT